MSTATARRACTAPAPPRAGQRASAQLAKGKFLVASRSLQDPNFAETVILLVDYDATRRARRGGQPAHRGGAGRGAAGDQRAAPAQGRRLPRRPGGARPHAAAGAHAPAAAAVAARLRPRLRQRQPRRAAQEHGARRLDPRLRRLRRLGPGPARPRGEPRRLVHRPGRQRRRLHRASDRGVGRPDRALLRRLGVAARAAPQGAGRRGSRWDAARRRSPPTGASRRRRPCYTEADSSARHARPSTSRRSFSSTFSCASRRVASASSCCRRSASSALASS